MIQPWVGWDMFRQEPYQNALQWLEERQQTTVVPKTDVFVFVFVLVIVIVIVIVFVFV